MRKRSSGFAPYDMLSSCFLSFEDAEPHADRRRSQSGSGIGAAVMREASEHHAAAGRLWSVIVTDGAEFPSVLVLTPGRGTPSSSEIEARVEAFASRLPQQDRLIELVEAQLEAERGFIIV